MLIFSLKITPKRKKTKKSGDFHETQKLKIKIRKSLVDHLITKAKVQSYALIVCIEVFMIVRVANSALEALFRSIEELISFFHFLYKIVSY